jgi:ribosomal protein L3 glutamine methyltransferase
MHSEYLTASDELKTLRDVLRWGMSQFLKANIYYGHGTDNPWDEALQLALYGLHLPMEVDKELLDCRLTHKERLEIFGLFEKRIEARIPIPYLTHRAFFAGFEFYVDERVLIPRSPMAELIEAQFSPWMDPDSIHRVLDLCTGSGCMAIAAAHYLPQAEVDGSDVSVQALEVAEKNGREQGVMERVHWIHSDVFNNIPIKPYDVIMSNPPYVDAPDMLNLPAEYQHEPQLALAAGEDGLVIAENILKNAISYLSPQGILIMEVGRSAEALEEKYPHVPFTWVEFSRGGDGVFILTRKELQQYFGEKHGR